MIDDRQQKVCLGASIVVQGWTKPANLASFSLMCLVSRFKLACQALSCCDILLYLVTSSFLLFSEVGVQMPWDFMEEYTII